MFTLFHFLREICETEIRNCNIIHNFLFFTFQEEMSEEQKANPFTRRKTLPQLVSMVSGKTVVLKEFLSFNRGGSQFYYILCVDISVIKP